MSERTTNTLLGAFVMGGIVIAVALIISITGSGLSRDAQKVGMVFDGSLTGLTVGAPVALRGVEIGQVTGIRVRLDDMSGVNLVMEVDADIDLSRVQMDSQAIEGVDSKLIESGLRAQLNSQSFLTGLLYIQLDFHPDTDIVIHNLSDGRVEIPTIPSPIEQFFEQVDQLHLPALAADLDAIARSVRSLLEDESLQAAPGRLIAILDGAEQTLETLDQTIDVLGPQLTDTLATTQTTIHRVGVATPRLLEQLDGNLSRLTDVMQSVENTSDQVANVLDADSPLLLSLTTTLREMERTSRSLNTLARSIEEQPQSLILGRPPTEDINP